MTTIPKNPRKIVTSVIAGVCALAAIGIIGYPASSGTIGIDRFNPKTYKGQTGKISLRHRGRSVLTAIDKTDRKFTEFSTSNGILLLPVGSYEILECKAIVTDKQKVDWSASMSPDDMLKIKITANETQQLDFGPPFVASIKVTTHGKKADMDLRLTTVQGNGNYIISKTNGKTNPPGFKVINSSGKVVWSGSFAYG